MENVRLVDRYQNQKTTSGTLYVTATHLIFVDPAGKSETWVGISLLQDHPSSSFQRPF